MQRLFGTYLTVMLWFGIGIFGFVLIANSDAIPWLTIFLSMFVLGICLVWYAYNIYLRAAAK